MENGGSFLGTLLLMGLLVLGFRLYIRRPRGVGQDDPPGVRTVAAFFGSDPEYLADDDPERPFVGIRLFSLLLDGLKSAGIDVSNRGPVEFAQGAQLALDGQRLAIVLEWIDPRWAISVEWTPGSAAERRHVLWTHKVYAPADTPALRRVLTAIDGWLRAQPNIRGIGWHRKERWMREDPTDPAEKPFEA